MGKPINVQLSDEALQIVLVNSTERGKGIWLSRLILLAARLPEARASELCGIIGEIEGLIGPVG